MEQLLVYSKDIPQWIGEICNTKPMKRLQDVGMNCGCEYTKFELFAGLPGYSRFEHSIGAALIVWKHTKSKEQAIAALLHDIATPVFAHTIDFLNGDYIKQESTEDRTREIILGSSEICNILENENVDPWSVLDYHKYPIADNDSPRLSSDRLEYTLGNAERYKMEDPKILQQIYDDLIKGVAEDGQEELIFTNQDKAERFTELALRCAYIYIADEDRYAMQILSELIQTATKMGVITEEDLYSTEAQVIEKLKADPLTNMAWKDFCNLSHMVTADDDELIGYRRIVEAKKRYIDPLVKDRGRVSELSSSLAEEIEQLKALTFDNYICGR